MNEWIAIVDMDQPGRRVPVALSDGDWDCATFSCVDEIKELHKDHSLGVFMWWAFNYVTGEGEEIF